MASINCIFSFCALGVALGFAFMHLGDQAASPGESSLSPSATVDTRVFLAPSDSVGERVADSSDSGSVLTDWLQG